VKTDISKLSEHNFGLSTVILLAYGAGVCAALLLALGGAPLIALHLFDGHHAGALAVVTPVVVLVPLVFGVGALRSHIKRPMTLKGIALGVGLCFGAYSAWVQWVSLLAGWWDSQLFALPGYLGGDYGLFILLFFTPLLLLLPDRSIKRVAIGSLALLGSALAAWLLSLRLA
jgi:hypothetical protein